MGHRGEIFTRKIFVKDGEKTYFFNIKENRYGDRFLNLVESSKREGGPFKRNSIMVYREDLTAFMEGFSQSCEHLKKKDKTKFTLSKGEETGRRTFHFSVKWNKFGWGSIFVSEERADYTSELHNEMILVDERDLEDFLKGYVPAMSKLREQKPSEPVKSLPPEKNIVQKPKVKISLPPKTAEKKTKKEAKKDKIKVVAKK